MLRVAVRCRVDTAILKVARANQDSLIRILLETKGVNGAKRQRGKAPGGCGKTPKGSFPSARFLFPHFYI